VISKYRDDLSLNRDKHLRANMKLARHNYVTVKPGKVPLFEEAARELIESLPVPVIISGGLRTPERVHEAFEHTGAEAVALARGSLGNPWLFSQLVGGRIDAPDRVEILTELDWVMDSAVEHLGEERAGRYLRKFYPWYVERLEGDKALQDSLQRAPSLQAARAILELT